MANADGKPGPLPHPQILIRNPGQRLLPLHFYLLTIIFFKTGEPGSKPFPGFVPHKEPSGAKLNLVSPPRNVPTSPVRQILVQSAVASSSNRLSSLAESKSKPVAKITPVKRTRFRTKDRKKIVLKRRKVKRIRPKPKGITNSEEFNDINDINNDNFAVGLAPEAHRGGSLAELALATLSEEELASEEKIKISPRNRDLQIMKHPKNGSKDRKPKTTLTFPTGRLKVALKEDRTDQKSSKSISSNTNAIKLRNSLFDPRKRFKGIKKGFKDRLRNPDSEETSKLPSSFPVDQPVSPFPNFPSIVETSSNDISFTEEQRTGRVVDEDQDIPNIGFEELKLVPKKQELDLEAETFLPILRPETKGSQQQFPVLNAVPMTDVVTQQQFPATSPQQSHTVQTPVKGEPLPISQFFDYGENKIVPEAVDAFPDFPFPSVPPVPQDPIPLAPVLTQVSTESVDNFPNFPFPSVSPVPPDPVPPAPVLTQVRPGGTPVENSSPFPDIFTTPRPGVNPSSRLPTTTPQPIFQNQPNTIGVEQPKSVNPPPFTFFQPVNTVEDKKPGPAFKGRPIPAVTNIAPDAGRMNSHKETIVGDSVLGEIAYVDVDGKEKILSYKKPNSEPPPVLNPIVPAFLNQQPILHESVVHHPHPQSPHILPVVPQPEEPPLFIRHHGSTVVPRLQPTPAPAPVQPSTQPPFPDNPAPVPVSSPQPASFVHHSPSPSPITSLHHPVNHSPSPAPATGPPHPPPVHSSPSPSPPPHHPLPALQRGFPEPGVPPPIPHTFFQPSPRPVILPTFTPSPKPSFLHSSNFPKTKPRFEPHPPLRPAVPPPPYQTPFRQFQVPPHLLNTRVPALTFLPPKTPKPIKSPLHLVTTVRPTIITTSSLQHPHPHPSPVPHHPHLAPVPHHPHLNPNHPHPGAAPHVPHPHPVPSDPSLKPHPTQHPSLPEPSPLKQAKSVTPAPFVVEHYPSPSPIPLIWKPNGAVFTPKPFVHIHTTVVPIVIKSTRPPGHYSSSSRPPIPPPTPSPPFHPPPKPQQFTTPHPHFFTTPYPQTPYPPLNYIPSPSPTFHFPAQFPYNGHALPAHVHFARRRDDLDMETGASQSSSDSLTLVRPTEEQESKKESISKDEIT